MNIKNLRKSLEREKGKFFKRLSKEIFDERVESHHVKVLIDVDQQVQLVLALRKECSYEYKTRTDLVDFRMLGELLGILRTLRKHYYEYILEKETTEVITELLIDLYEEYTDAYWKAFMKNLGATEINRRSIMTEEEAFKELVYRGFKPMGYLTTKHNPKTDYFLNGGCTRLVHPLKLNDQADARKIQRRIGLTGFTGYNEPRP